jgi:hypothetical protein
MLQLKLGIPGAWNSLPSYATVLVDFFRQGSVDTLVVCLRCIFGR